MLSSNEILDIMNQTFMLALRIAFSPHQHGFRYRRSYFPGGDVNQ